MWQFADTTQYDDLTLIHIASHEDIDLDTRYKAVNELQYRRIPSEIQAEVLYLSGIGKPIEEIAYQVGYSEEQVNTCLLTIKKRNKERYIEEPLNRDRKRIYKWEKGHKYFGR